MPTYESLVFSIDCTGVHLSKPSERLRYSFCSFLLELAFMLHAACNNMRVIYHILDLIKVAQKATRHWVVFAMPRVARLASCTGV